MKNQVAKLDHLNFTVSNFKDSVDWYQNIFNFKLVEEGLTRDNQQWGVLKSGDTMLVIVERSQSKKNLSENIHQLNHFGLRLVDVDEWEKKITEYKLQTFYDSPVDYPNSKSWYVEDPTGNEIEVSIWNNNQVKF